MTRRAGVAVLALVAALVLAAPLLASEERPTLAELESEVYCPTCKSLLSLSNAPIAQRMRQFINERITAGDTSSEIKDALVAQFGEAVLAAPPKRGFNLLAWVLPLVGLVAAGAVVALLVRRWRDSSRTEEQAPAGAGAGGDRPLDPELERRLDEELSRFDG